MNILTGRHPYMLSELPFIETNLDHPGMPIHPADLAKKAELWVRNSKDFATVSEIPILVAQMLVRTKIVVCDSVILTYRDEHVIDRLIHLDIHGEFIEPWPPTMEESIFDVDFCIRFSK